MAVLTEGMHRGEYIFSESNGSRSRGTGTVLSGETLEAGDLVGIVTASGKYAKYDNSAGDGRESVAGISYDAVDASSADFTGVVFTVRDCEVVGASLDYNTVDAGEITTANTELEALGIIVR